MLAYKFLDAHGRAPFTGTPWRPDEWVEASNAAACREGVHGCRAADVAFWLSASMWRVELDGDVVDTRHKVVASRGRLVAPIDGYDAAVRELGTVCAWRCRDRAVAALRGRRRFLLARRFARASTLDALVTVGARCQGDALAEWLGALAGDAAREAIRGLPARAPFVAAVSAGHEAAGRADDQDAFDAAYLAEREHQSAWLTRRLSLT